MNPFERILYALQKEMERPTVFGWFHIICLIITIILILYLVKKKSKDEKTLKRLLLIYGISALALEILKQIVWSFNYDPNTNLVTWDYNWYAAPFQLCTTPIFVSLICAFSKKGRTRDALLSYMAFVTILGSLSTAIYPESCFVRTILINIHTMVLHLGSLVVSVYLLISKEVKLNKRNLFDAYFVFLIFVGIALLMNIIIYHSGILHGETFNMFYISPYFTSVLPVFDIVQTHAPYLVYLLFYLVMLFLGSLIIYEIAKLIQKQTTKNSNKN